MAGSRLRSHLVSVVFLISALSAIASPLQPEPQQPPDNIAGNWTIYANNIDRAGSSLKTVQITQNGSILTGRFKGPHQSGKLQGWVNVNHVEFSTDTREVLTFRGEIQGNIISGLYGIRGRHAPFRAERTDSPH